MKAEELSISMTLAASKMSIETAGAAIIGTFGSVTGAISGFFTETIVSMFISLGEIIEAFLTAIATSLDISIFGQNSRFLCGPQWD